MSNAHMIVGQTGPDSFPEHSGKIVFPYFFGEMIIDHPGRPTRLVQLYKTRPALLSSAGNGEIVWKREHLQPLTRFPKEVFENELLNER